MMTMLLTQVLPCALFFLVAAMVWFQWRQLKHLQRQQQDLENKLLQQVNEHAQQMLTWQNQAQDKSIQNQQQQQQQVIDTLNNQQRGLFEQLNQHNQQWYANNSQHIKTLQETLKLSLSEHAQLLTKQVETLTHTTEQKLQQISQQVEKRLNEGFEKTTATFTDIVKRLALIDDAQKKLTELSGNVISLQQILADKRARGAFGEVQLNSLIDNMLPRENVAYQYTLGNGNRVDCILFLPEPTGSIAIDAKFPLENFQKLIDVNQGEQDKIVAKQRFKQDIKKHIQDIASKYIVAEETADSAVMFIPAESVFAEIHSQFPEIVQLAHEARVWLVSPTTLMAILTTAAAVIKDSATRKHVNLIQTHLKALAKDFTRFNERMDKLAKHIDQAHDDVQLVNTSAKKINSRFNKIEQVEIAAPELLEET